MSAAALLVMMTVSAPPSAPAIRAQVVNRPIAAAPTRSLSRVAQVAPLPEPPQPGFAAPQPVPPPPPADPFGAPHLPPQDPQVSAPSALPADPGYRTPAPMLPVGEQLPSPMVPAPVVAANGFVGNCPDCYGCPSCDDDDGCCLCGPPHPCNMFPHYAYYPKYHGHYYFRPYNYTTVFQQQQWAAAAGLDPRNPYSNKIFECVFAGYEQLFRAESAPVGSALPTGNNLPQLESLIEK